MPKCQYFWQSEPGSRTKYVSVDGLDRKSKCYWTCGSVDSFAAEYGPLNGCQFFNGYGDIITFVGFCQFIANQPKRVCNIVYETTDCYEFCLYIAFGIDLKILKLR